MIVEGWVGSEVIAMQCDDYLMFVPNEPTNRHRQAIAEWESSGNTIPSNGRPALIDDIDFSGATLTDSTLTHGGQTYGVNTKAGGITPYITSIDGPGWGVFGAAAQTPSPSTYDRCETTMMNHSVNFGELRHVGVKVYIPYNDPVYPIPNHPSAKWNYLLQFPQGDLPSALPVAMGIRVSGGRPILELRRGNNTESVREWSVDMDGSGDDFLYNRAFHVLVTMKLHDTNGFLQVRVHKPWSGETIISPEYNGALGFTGGDDKCSVKFGMYRGKQDAQTGQNASPGAYFAFKDIRISNNLQLAKTW